MHSLSGRFGESTSLATRVFFLPRLRYILNVLLCPTMWPPIASVGSPKNASGFAITWFVTYTQRLCLSASSASVCMCLFSFCCLSASVPLPTNSALKCAVSESTIIILTLCPSFIRSSTFSASSIWWSELNALATFTRFSVSSGSSPKPSANCIILSGLNVFSVSMYTTIASGSSFCTLTARLCPICVFPEPYCPKHSVIAPVSNPPSSMVSMLLLPDFIFSTVFLLFSISVPDWKPMSSPSLAACIIFLATASLTPAASVSVPMLATAMLSKSSNPASASFSAVAAPTPGRSMTSIFFSFFTIFFTF